LISVRYACDRVGAFLQELSRLKGSEFPYSDSKQALEELEQYFKGKLATLEALDSASDRDVVKLACQRTLHDLFTYLPFLGFILRSTNVRNAFEFFGPFWRLAGDVLEPDVPVPDRKTRLLFSSEWDYIPFTFFRVPHLDQFVFIGLPAPESSNPLLFPLAGHELGHTSWAAAGLDTTLVPLIKSEIVRAILAHWDEFLNVFETDIKQDDLTTDLFAYQLWADAVELCRSYAQEIFCDYIGLRLFAESFLHAFAYLLSPGYGKRGIDYPGIAARVKYLREAAESTGVMLPERYEELFAAEELPDVTEADRFRIAMADEALGTIRSTLLAEALKRVGPKAPSRSMAEVARIRARFELVVPAEECRSLSDILNAAWSAYHDPSLWKDIPHARAQRDRVLKELTLKNVEVLHYEQLVKSTGA
jgi:hypothetical protein